MSNFESNDPNNKNWTNHQTKQENVKTVKGDYSNQHFYYHPTNPKSEATLNEKNDPVKVNPREGYAGYDRNWTK